VYNAGVLAETLCPVCDRRLREWQDALEALSCRLREISAMSPHEYASKAESVIAEARWIAQAARLAFDDHNSRHRGFNTSQPFAWAWSDGDAENGRRTDLTPSRAGEELSPLS
jgi:hypothetical protein